MEAMRRSWTDERLDALNEKVDRGFEAVDKRFEAVDRRFEEVGRRFDRVEDRIEGLDKGIHARFDSMQKTMVQSSVLVVVAMIGVVATQL